METLTYKLVDRIKRKGYPTTSKKWRKSHLEANRQEKKANPKLFKAIQRRISKMPSNELAGTHTKRGQTKVSKKFLKMFPKKMRRKVAHSIGNIHEKIESRLMRKRGKK